MFQVTTFNKINHLHEEALRIVKTEIALKGLKQLFVNSQKKYAKFSLKSSKIPDRVKTGSKFLE